MGIEKRTTTIDGHTYELTTLGARKGQHVLLRLTKILGPIIMTVSEKGIGGLDDAFGKIAGASDSDLDYLIDTFAGSCNVLLIAETKAGPRQVSTKLLPTYDDHFAGRYTASLEWLAWCVQENFADFFVSKTKEKPKEAEHEPDQEP